MPTEKDKNILLNNMSEEKCHCCPYFIRRKFSFDFRCELGDNPITECAILIKHYNINS